MLSHTATKEREMIWQQNVLRQLGGVKPYLVVRKR